MQLSKIFLALMASSTLVLTGCGGGGGSSSGSDTENPGTPSGGDNNSGGDDSGDNTSGDGGNTQQASWSTPTELEDGSVTVSKLMVGGSANKPMMAYSKGNRLYIREFDGSNWSDAQSITSYNGTHDISWAFNANGKAVLALENNATNGATGLTECRLDYIRYNGTQWGSYIRARHLINPNNNYTCHNVDDLKIALSDDDSVALTWNRGDLTANTGRVQGCDSTDTCVTDAELSPQTLGSDYKAVALGMGNDGEGYILKMETSNFASNASGVFATGFSDGYIGSSTSIGVSNHSRLARVAVNDATHALALFNDNNTLQARFNNGSGFATSVELDDDLAGANYEATLEAYLSTGADYGLSLWVNNWTDLKTNISDAGSFSASSTEHPRDNDVIQSVTGAINDNGKAVIVWFGYDLDMTSGIPYDGTLYARFYDGSAWLDVQTIDSDIDVASFLSVKGGLGVYLDNSDDVTVVYNAYKDTQLTTEPKTFYTRRVID